MSTSTELRGRLTLEIRFPLGQTPKGQGEPPVRSVDVDISGPNRGCSAPSLRSNVRLSGNVVLFKAEVGRGVATPGSNLQSPS